MIVGALLVSAAYLVERTDKSAGGRNLRHAILYETTNDANFTRQYHQTLGTHDVTISFFP